MHLISTALYIFIHIEFYSNSYFIRAMYFSIMIAILKPFSSTTIYKKKITPLLSSSSSSWSTENEITVTVGRDSNSNVILEEISCEVSVISRKHAMVRWLRKSADSKQQQPSSSSSSSSSLSNQFSLSVFDKDSTNGVLVNWKRILPRTFIELHAGDIVCFGGGYQLTPGSGMKRKFQSPFGFVVVDVPITELLAKEATKKQPSKQVSITEVAIEDAKKDPSIPPTTPISSASTNSKSTPSSQSSTITINNAEASISASTPSPKEDEEERVRLKRLLDESLAELERMKMEKEEESKRVKEAEMKQKAIEEELKVAKRAIEDVFSCPVCLDPPKAMLILPCGHSVCEECWVVWSKKSPMCPTCRSVIRKKPVRARGMEPVVDILNLQIKTVNDAIIQSQNSETSQSKQPDEQSKVDNASGKLY